jgi:[ribosomal protein S5]-alanine N-acetyltransferase
MPTIRTARLSLRPPVPADAPEVARYVGDFDVARMLAPVPHPYAVADAEWWIGTQATPEGQAKEQVFVATLDGALIGACSHILGGRKGSSEIGYWVGKPHWGKGYCTEMTAALIRHGFAAHGLGTITISHMIDNPASAAVIAKFGFRPTGRRRIGCTARGCEVEVLTYALTRAQAEAKPWYGSP